jgi:hypothetical protein
MAPQAGGVPRMAECPDPSADPVESVKSISHAGPEEPALRRRSTLPMPESRPKTPIKTLEVFATKEERCTVHWLSEVLTFFPERGVLP